MWVAGRPPGVLPYNRGQHNIHPRDRPDGRRGSCDVEVLGAAVPPGSEDFHHHERRREAAPGAVGHAVGRRRRPRALAGAEDRQGLPPRHLRLPPRRRRPRRRGRLLQRLRPRAVPALRVGVHRGQRAGRQRRSPVALPRLRARVQPGDGHRLRWAQAAGRRLDGVPPGGLLLREHGGGRQIGPQVGRHAALLAGEAVRGARGGAGGDRPRRQGADRRDDVPAAARGPAQDAGRLQGAGRLLQGQALHRHRLRRPRGLGVRRRGARQDQRRARPSPPSGAA